MNEQNLIPGAHKLTVEEQSEGGRASGKVRRQKRDMKKTMELLLQLPPGTQEDYECLVAAGVSLNTLSDEELTNMLVVNAALLNKAKSGDVNAIKELRSIIHDVESAQDDADEDDGLLEALNTKADEVFTDED